MATKAAGPRPDRERNSENQCASHPHLVHALAFSFLGSNSCPPLFALPPVIEPDHPSKLVPRCSLPLAYATTPPTVVRLVRNQSLCF